MERRHFLGRSLAIAAAGRVIGLSQDERPPNIVLLVAGGWRGQALPFAGDRYAVTPNLQRLKSEGIWFHRAYTPNPERDPAKAALLTGRYPHAANVVRNGVPLPANESTLAKLLSAGGYSTRLFGGWNTDSEGIDDTAGYLAQPPDQPFFLGITWEMDPDAPAELPERRFRVPSNIEVDIADGIQQNWASHYAECARIDAEVGRILASLDAQNMARNTVVVFTADRGSMLGSHGLFGDGQPFEEAVRVPLLIRYPRSIRTRRTIDIPVCSVDLAPTLLALSGLPGTGDFQGNDLSRWLIDGEGERSESIYCQGRLGTEEEWRLVVRGFDKIVVDRELNISHLFNLRQDPYEMDNLAGEKGQRTKQDEMRAILYSRMRSVSDRILPSGLKLRD